MKKVVTCIKNLEDGHSKISYFDVPDNVEPIDFIKHLIGYKMQRNVEIKIIRVWDFTDYLDSLRDEVKSLKGKIKWLKGVLRTAKKDLKYLETILQDEENKTISSKRK